MATKKVKTKKLKPTVDKRPLRDRLSDLDVAFEVLEESMSRRFAQMYDVIESLDNSSATRDKVNKVHDRVTKLEQELENRADGFNATLVMIIFLVILSALNIYLFLAG